MAESATDHFDSPSAELRPVGSRESRLPAIHDCWNQVGVSGNATCAELARFYHCRNCPVYSAAALQLLDRPLPADYRREHGELYAQHKRVSRPARLSVVLFRVGGEWFALPAAVFQEVAEDRVIHSLPHRRRGLALGLVNVRGELLVCASATRLLGVESTSGDSQSPGVGRRLLVAAWEGQRIVLPADEVHGLERIHLEDVKPPPATVAKSDLSLTTDVFNWREHTVGLLNPEPFFATLNRNLA